MGSKRLETQEVHEAREQHNAEIEEKIYAKLKRQLRDGNITEDHRKSIEETMEEKKEERTIDFILDWLDAVDERHLDLKRYTQMEPAVITQEEADGYEKKFKENPDFFQAIYDLDETLYARKKQWDRERSEERDQAKKEDRKNADKLLYQRLKELKEWETKKKAYSKLLKENVNNAVKQVEEKHGVKLSVKASGTDRSSGLSAYECYLVKGSEEIRIAYIKPYEFKNPTGVQFTDTKPVPVEDMVYQITVELARFK